MLLNFTTVGGVTITYQADEKQAEVIISDTGIGIPPLDRTRLFGKFEQLTPPATGKAIGSGLGLYIARQIARQMGGNVFLEKSEPGKGSTFIMTLPLAAS